MAPIRRHRFAWLCRDKKCWSIYGCAEQNLLGCRACQAGRRRIVFSDHASAAIACELDPPPPTIALKSDPDVLMRPDSRRHVRGTPKHAASPCVF